MKKEAKDLDHPIHPLLEKRWSPKSMKRGQVSREDLNSMLEAARWAPSSFNEQPWRFIYGFHGTPEFEKIFSCLKPANQEWAGNCGLLLITFAKKSFTKNGKPNRTANHDVGLAVMSLVLEATKLGYYVHQMGGIEQDTIRSIFAIPEEFEALTITAIGELEEENILTFSADPKEFTAQKRKQIELFAGEGVFVND